MGTGQALRPLWEESRAGEGPRPARRQQWTCALRPLSRAPIWSRLQEAFREGSLEESSALLSGMCIACCLAFPCSVALRSLPSVTHVGWHRGSATDKQQTGYRFASVGESDVSPHIGG